MKNVFTLILSVIILSSCCRDNECPDNNFGAWIEPYEETISFVNTTNDTITSNLIYTEIENQEPQRHSGFGCGTCNGNMEINTAFIFNNQNYDLSITISTDGLPSENSLHTNSINFRLNNDYFLWDVNSDIVAYADSIKYLGTFNISDTVNIENCYIIDDIIYSKSEGLIQFTTEDNEVWKKVF